MRVGRCLTRLVSDFLRVGGRIPPRGGMGRTRLVNHCLGVMRRITRMKVGVSIDRSIIPGVEKDSPGVGQVGVSPGWLINPQVRRDLLIDIQLGGCIIY